MSRPSSSQTACLHIMFSVNDLLSRCRHEPVFFLPPPQKRACSSPSRPHYITSTNLSNNNQTRNDAQTLKTRQLFGAFLSIPPFSSSSLCFPLPPSSFFSLLNCKYQVPFILFCYFCYYCYYIVVLVIFFFSLVDRRSSGRTVYPQSQSVNTISFQSLVQEGKNRTKCFIFILSPSISLFTTFPFPP